MPLGHKGMNLEQNQQLTPPCQAECLCFAISSLQPPWEVRLSQLRKPLSLCSGRRQEILVRTAVLEPGGAGWQSPFCVSILLRPLPRRGLAGFCPSISPLGGLGLTEIMTISHTYFFVLFSLGQAHYIRECRKAELETDLWTDKSNLNHLIFFYSY